MCLPAVVDSYMRCEVDSYMRFLTIWGSLESSLKDLTGRLDTSFGFRAFNELVALIALVTLPGVKEFLIPFEIVVTKINKLPNQFLDSLDHHRDDSDVGIIRYDGLRASHSSARLGALEAEEVDALSKGSFAYVYVSK